MKGFDYINAWEFPLTPIITLIVGVMMFISLLGFGKYLLRITGYHIPEPWLSAVGIVFGVLLFSLAVQIVSMMGMANSWRLISLMLFILPFGLNIVSRKPSLTNIIPPHQRKAKFPVAIVLTAMLTNLLVSLAPSTKIDEITYHMLIPSRILRDGGLIYYQMPWEAAIFPQLFYQIMVAPFYALGLPDSANVLSFALFVTLIWFALTLVWQQTKHAALSWWVAALISVGMYSVVDLVTGGGHSFMVLSTAVGALAVFSRQTLLKDISLSAWVVMCSILLIGMASAKVSLMPVVFLLLLGIFWQITKEKEFQLSRLKTLIPMAMALVIYLPIITWTWVNSGSPFGPLFSDFFAVDTTTFDTITFNTIRFNRITFNTIAFNEDRWRSVVVVIVI